MQHTDTTQHLTQPVVNPGYSSQLRKMRINPGQLSIYCTRHCGVFSNRWTPVTQTLEQVDQSRSSGHWRSWEQLAGAGERSCQLTAQSRNLLRRFVQPNGSDCGSQPAARASDHQISLVGNGRLSTRVPEPSESDSHHRQRQRVVMVEKVTVFRAHVEIRVKEPRALWQALNRPEETTGGLRIDYHRCTSCGRGETRQWYFYVTNVISISWTIISTD